MAQVFCEESHTGFQKEPEACSDGAINHMQEYFNANNAYKRCHYAPNFPSWAVPLTIRPIKHLLLPMVLYCSSTFIICNNL